MQFITKKDEKLVSLYSNTSFSENKGCQRRTKFARETPFLNRDL